MPTVFAASSSRPSDRRRLRRLFTAPISDAEAAEARELVNKSGAVARTIELARSRAKRASGFAAAAGAESLISLPDHFLSRQLGKVTAEFRIEVVPSGHGDLDDPPSHGQLEHWETERVG
jgi:hypothetical protein